MNSEREAACIFLNIYPVLSSVSAGETQNQKKKIRTTRTDHSCPRQQPRAADYTPRRGGRGTQQAEQQRTKAREGKGEGGTAGERRESEEEEEEEVDFCVVSVPVHS